MPTLVPLVADGGITYRLRIGDSTVAIPEYLAADLLLGRRAYARIELRGVDTHASFFSTGSLGSPLPSDSSSIFASRMSAYSPSMIF
jgi:hypothetical protein